LSARPGLNGTVLFRLIAVEEIQWGDADWTHLAHIRTQWHVLVNTTSNK